MTSIAAVNSASGKYATAWREFATASRSVAERKDTLQQLLRSGTQGDTSRFDSTISAVGRLQGSRDALARSQEELAKTLDGFQPDSTGLSPGAVAAFKTSIEELRSDVSLPPDTIPWKARMWAHGDGDDRFGYGVLGSMGGGLALMATAIPFDGGASTITGAEWAISSGAAGGVALLPGVLRTKRGGSAFAYVDAVTKLTSDAVNGKPVGDKLRLSDVGVKSRKKVKVGGMLKGLDKLAANAEGRAGTAERQARELQTRVTKAGYDNSNSARVGTIFEQARSGAAERLAPQAKVTSAKGAAS